jgi:rhodanese-related sulfurtransferase
LIPINCPREFTKAPPLLPGFTAASVCINDSIRNLSFSKFKFLALALTIPAVTVEVRLNGLPMASTHSPTSTSSEFPKDKKFVLHCAGGYRSMIAASILKQRGWDNFVDVVGGFSEIKNTNLLKSDYVCPTTLL